MTNENVTIEKIINSKRLPWKLIGKQKHQCQGPVFNKVAVLLPEACKFIKKMTPSQLLACEICEIFNTTFFIEPFWWLLFQQTYQRQ